MPRPLLLAACAAALFLGLGLAARPCPACKGTGWDYGDRLRADDQGPCDTCGGRGKVPAAKK